MGNFLCGGRNREHDYTNQYKRLDSFYFGRAIPALQSKGMKHIDHTITWSDGASIAVALFPDKLHVGYVAGSERENVHEVFYFDAVPNNYGGADRYYFACPRCGRRCRFLYVHCRRFKCRKCADLNYPRQRLNNSNEDVSIYKMRKILRDGFKIKENLSPMEASAYRPNRPKGMHHKTYIRLSIKLLRAQQDYTNHLWAFVGRLRGGQ